MANKKDLEASGRAVFGWCMYDWANSAYILTAITAVLPVYFSGVVVPADGLRIGGQHYSATSLWGFAISAAAALVFLSAPVLGAIADFSAAKKKFLMVFCYTGSLAATSLYFCGSGDVGMTMTLVVVSQIGFVGANIFYDAFLPHLVPPSQMDWVSGKGYAYGYIGGDIQFLLSLLLMTQHEWFGLTQTDAVRIVLAFSGLWWAGFSVFTWVHLRDVTAPSVLPERYRAWPRALALAHIGLRRTLDTTRRVSQLRHLAVFLVGFMLYNEGIQTVIVMATIYGKEELDLPIEVLMITLFVIQLVAMGGALGFGKLAERIGARRAIMISLVVWSAIVVYAYFMTSALEYTILGVLVGIVLGGSQSLSRSFYGSMIPAGASAEFYGFYSVFTKFSAIGGPLLFGVIRHLSGSSRMSIASLIVFFAAGLFLLSLVDERKARAAAGLDAQGSSVRV
jgi:UMF1 family MFS transporter